MKDIKSGTPLLLHVCCGPCASAVVERLRHHFALTLFYYNPNMDSRQEYLRRQQALEQLLHQLPTDSYPVKAVFPDYDPAPYDSIAQGLEEEPEGGQRCARCFELRLAETARVAAANQIPWMCTTLSVSPHKNALLINKLGESAARSAGVQYLPSDFKKKDGYRQSVLLSTQMGLYRQDYCGCIYSKRPPST